MHAEVRNLSLDECVVQGVDAQLRQQYVELVVGHLAEVILCAHLHQHLHLHHGEALGPRQQALPELVAREGAFAAAVELGKGLTSGAGDFGDLLAVAELDGLGDDLHVALLLGLVVGPSSEQSIDDLGRLLHERLPLDPPAVQLRRAGQQQLDVPICKPQGRGVQQIRHLFVSQLPLVLLVGRVEDVHEQGAEGQALFTCPREPRSAHGNWVHFRDVDFVLPRRRLGLLRGRRRDPREGRVLRGRLQPRGLEGRGEVVQLPDLQLVPDDAVNPPLELAIRQRLPADGVQHAFLLELVGEALSLGVVVEVHAYHCNGHRLLLHRLAEDGLQVDDAVVRGVVRGLQRPCDVRIPTTLPSEQLLLHEADHVGDLASPNDQALIELVHRWRNATLPIRCLQS
mmetsp:Transcript_43312/g.139171  ORF Transcript_43312/g.139171 Transcript_43312/m.139171 type:complete len:398 (+) Transcript_43312:1117-2310(+)